MLVMLPTVFTLITSPVYVPGPTSPPTTPAMFASTPSAGVVVVTHFVKVPSKVCPFALPLYARAAPAVVVTNTNTKRILHFLNGWILVATVFVPSFFRFVISHSPLWFFYF